jgi:hypothetical protein
LHAIYRNWARTNGLHPLSARKFHERMGRDHKLHWVNGDQREYPNVAITTQEYRDVDM